ASFATANIPIALSLGGIGGILGIQPRLNLNVKAINNPGKAKMKNVKTFGFVISNPTNATIGLSGLGNSLVVSLLDSSGKVVGTSDTDNASPLALDLLGNGAGNTN